MRIAGGKDALPQPPAESGTGPDERTEIIGQLQRSLALLRACDGPAIRAQIQQMAMSLRGRLLQLSLSAGTPPGSRYAIAPLVPNLDTAFELRPAECRAYAIQCEAMASMVTSSAHRDMLLALARLWRALASGQT